MRTIIAGNWKMNKDRQQAADLAAALAAMSKDWPPHVEVIIAPPFPFLEMAVERAGGSRLHVAAQNCHEAEEGAFTGEVSARMLKSIGVDHCIVGHSERRQHFAETDEAVGRKVATLLKHGITPIYCCGEDQQQRETAVHFDIVATQIHKALGALDPEAFKGLVIAYEPVWAIGTGLNATPEQAQEMHAFIRAEVRRLSEDAEEIPILYGGSCKPENARALFAGRDVNGGLIGGASLDAMSFGTLVEIAQRMKSA